MCGLSRLTRVFWGETESTSSNLARVVFSRVLNRSRC